MGLAEGLLDDGDEGGEDEEEHDEDVRPVEEEADEGVVLDELLEAELTE